MTYDFKAIPEATWTAFVAAISGLVGAICVAAGADAALTAAIVTFVGAFGRLAIAFLIALASKEGTVSLGNEGGHADISGAVTAAVIVLVVLIFLTVTDFIEWRH